MPIKLKSLKRNPKNPRIIKDDDFYSLVESIRTFPQMLELRPLVVDESRMILAGDKRMLALLELKYTEVPTSWVKYARDLTEAQKQEFIIKDNLHAGAWDFDRLANEWDATQLQAWNLSIPGFTFSGSGEDDPPPADGQLYPDTTTITVMLATDQAKVVKQALAAVKAIPDFADRNHHGNTHQNGNAFYQIVKEWAELKAQDQPQP